MTGISGTYVKMLNNKGGKMKMNWIWILIIGILIGGYMAHAYTDKMQQYLGPAYDWVDKLISGKTTPKEEGCTDEYKPVCADGKTYSNACVAGLAGVEEVTEGEC